jgi:CBS domain-containing protein
MPENTPVNLEEALSFLRKVPPFQFLDEHLLRKVAGCLSLTVYPKDTVVLKQHGPPSDCVRIIRRGAVRVMMESPESGEEVILDYKGEGDNFGFLSLIGGDRQRTTCIADDDTTCYVLSKECVYDLLEASPAFSEYYMAYLSRYVDRTYQEMRQRSLSYAGGDQHLFVTPIGDIAVKPITIGEEATIQEAARIMAEHKISSVIVVDPGGAALGILTDRDFREKVVAQGRPVTDPVRHIAQRSLIQVDASESCFETLIKMVQHNIHHMPVVKDGTLCGVVTNHDLLLLQGTSPLSLVHDILNQTTVAGLAPLAQKTNNVVGLLIKADAKAGQITRVITEINDRMIARVLEIAEERFGPPPLPYCWVLFGSEGRKEQTFKTDQDNALIYTDPLTPALAAEAQTYFKRFTEFLAESLMALGFPRCPAGYMAVTPDWCQPLKVWKGYFSRWVNEPVPENLLRFLVFYDLRSIYGKGSLAQDLREFVVKALAGKKLFLGYMANKVLEFTPPIGFFKTFVVEKSGEHKDKFDLKVKGITPLLNAVRLFAMEKGLKETGTLERLEALRKSHSIVRDHFEEIDHAFEFVMMLRIHHQFEQIQQGLPPDNFINPNDLSNLERKMLKESFNLMSRIQGLIVEQWKTFIR